MARDYKLSRKVTQKESEEIVKEVTLLNNVKKVIIIDDYLEVETYDNDFSQVMARAVNICGKIAEGCEISFAKFVL
ncbi:MAG: hypothetical protein ACERKN_15735 [Velocimicrobium sp.]